MKYFTTCPNLGALKKEYRRLTMFHHPDHGGDTSTIAAINNEIFIYRGVKNAGMIVVKAP